MACIKQNQILTMAVSLCLFLVHVLYIKKNTYLYLAIPDILYLDLCLGKKHISSPPPFNLGIHIVQVDSLIDFFY